MKMKQCGSLAVLAILGATISAGAATAATITWSSHDPNSDPSDNAIWTNSANWVGGIAPVGGDDLVFPVPATNGTRTTNNDFAAGTQFNGINITANSYVLGGNSINLGGPVAFTAGGSNISTISLPMAMLQDTTFSVAANTSNGRLQVDGDIGGAFDLIKDDAGRLRFGGTTKTYSGDTIITGGLIDTGVTNTLPFGAGKGDVYIGTGAQLVLVNVSVQINGLNDYAGGAGSVVKSGSNSRQLTIGNGDANGSFSGAMTFTGGGASTINKVGAGTQTLSGAVSVTGPGTVSGGRLNIDGTWSSGVAVNTPGTLGGIGSIAGAVTGTGTVSPGQSIGTLSVGSANSSGTLSTELSGAGAGSSDLLIVTGDLNITAMSVDFDVLSNLNDLVYVFAQYGSLTGTQFANVIDLPGPYEIDYAYEGNKIALVAIPEPGTTVLFLAAALATACMRRRDD